MAARDTQKAPWDSVPRGIWGVIRAQTRPHHPMGLKSTIPQMKARDTQTTTRQTARETLRTKAGRKSDQRGKAGMDLSDLLFMLVGICRPTWDTLAKEI